ncbi:MAG: MFS transporter [Kurthia sp.]|nr:MFS transporter [Candidatus Kurthia equi]
MTIETARQKWSATAWLLTLGIVFIALTLRSPLTSVGPIINDIKNSLHISSVAAGFITTIPLLAFAVVSPMAPIISRKISIERTLFISMIILAFGIALRSIGNTSMLFLGTLLIGIGIAFGNVLLPSLIKLKFPLQVGLLTAIYTMSMNTSASIAAGVSYPLSTLSFGWQGSLGIWIIFAIIALGIWIPQIKTKKILDEVPLTSIHEKKPMWRFPLAWVIMIAMGFQSMIFYTTAAWFPEMFKNQGLTSSEAGFMFSIMQISQIPMTFITPIIAGKLKDQRIIIVIFALFYIVGFGGLLMGWTDLSVLWMILLGFAGGASFSMCMMFFSLRAKDSFEAADLSGFSQSLGYLIAAVGPVLYGYLYDKTQSFNSANIMYIFAVTVSLVASYIAAKDRFVTDRK